MNELLRIKNGESKNPHAFLGMHQEVTESKEHLVVRVFCPDAKEVTVVHMNDKTKKYKLAAIDEDGYFEGIMGRRKITFPYLLECKGENNTKWSYIDPYQFSPLITDLDLHLFGEGNHYEIYNKLGAHFESVGQVEGVYFAVWAPAAKRVSVVGEFNNWDGRRHAMRLVESHGVWELFIPGLAEGDVYKYEIKIQDDTVIYKADPYANWSEVRPHTASRVCDMRKYKWHDSKWMEKRKDKQYVSEPVSIYEVHIGSWKKHLDGNFYTYREMADDLVKYLLEMNYTHVELLGVMEHPFDGSWGYQVTGYFAPTSRYGTPDDFRYFVDTMHAKGIGVLLDWVPAHFPRDAFALEKFDGTALYEHFNPIQANHPQWGTLIFNYGRNEVALFLIASALSWLEHYHLDGLRVDAVASMLYLDYGREGGKYIPNSQGGRENLEAVECLKKLNTIVYEKHPGVMMIAEESTSWKGVTAPVYYEGLGFGFKWNMGWMNDFLDYMKQDPLYRKYHHSKITFSLMYAFNENFVLPLSHDEVVHGKSCMLYKMPGDMWQKFANLRAAYGYMFMHPGKKMLFMGNEFAQTREWSEERELDWYLLQHEPHEQMRQYMKDLNIFYRKYSCLWEIDNSYKGFEWIDCDNKETSVISFVRKGKKDNDRLVVVINFTPEVWQDYRIGVEKIGEYKEVFNSDAICYGGSGIQNGIQTSEEVSWNDREYSISMTVPPLGISIFKWQENVKGN
ncbi:MAG: 1,4-alpha-glucan branching protein GlgB [Cellulosilyticaceae bacterium]